MENLKMEILKFEIIKEFLEVIRKEFERGEEELKKVTELKKVKQEQQTMDEYIQMFKRAARASSYKRRLLVKEFKRDMNRGIRRRLMEVEYPSKSINQWYKRVVRLERNCRKSRREKEEK